MMTLCN